MAQKEVIVQGAICECQFGFTPDKLKVLTQQMHYANDKDGSIKLIASDKDIGMTFEKNSFGQCKLQPTTGGYLPCIPALQKWEGTYQDVILTNKGKILTEDSKGTCAIAGSPCIRFTHSGQTTQLSQKNIENTDKQLLSQINPLITFNSLDEEPSIDFKTYE